MELFGGIGVVILYLAFGLAIPWQAAVDAWGWLFKSKTKPWQDWFVFKEFVCDLAGGLIVFSLVHGGLAYALFA